MKNLDHVKISFDEHKIVVFKALFSIAIVLLVYSILFV